VSPKAFAAMLVVIAALFAAVWGGGWYILTASRERAAEDRLQRSKADDTRAAEETRPHRVEAAPKAPPKALPKAPPKVAPKPKVANKAAKAKTDRQRDEDRRRRIDLLTGIDLVYYHQFLDLLPKQPIKGTPMEWDPNAIAFLINNTDLYPEGLAARRLSELADDHGAGKFIADQEIEPLAQPRCKLTLIQLRGDIQEFAVKLLDRAREKGLAGLSDFDKDFIKNYPALFPKYNR